MITSRNNVSQTRPGWPGVIGRMKTLLKLSFAAVAVTLAGCAVVPYGPPVAYGPPVVGYAPPPVVVVRPAYRYHYWGGRGYGYWR